MSSVRVVVPTHDRPEGLERALAALAPQIAAMPERVEVVVVENGSLGAAKIAQAHGAGYLSLQQGNASLARNAGARGTKGGDVVVFLDDDAIPTAGWLSKIVAPVLTEETEATVGGVRLELGAEASELVKAVFVDTSLVMDASRPFLIGMNMAIRADVFAALGGFRPEIGPGALGGGEDLLLGLQLSEAGGRIRFVPEAIVIHSVPADRLTRRALMARMAGAGRGDGWIAHHWHGASPRLLRLRLLRSRFRLMTCADLDAELNAVQHFWREHQMLLETSWTVRLWNRLHGEREKRIQIPPHDVA